MYFFGVPPLVSFTLTMRTSRPTDARMAQSVRRSVSLEISMGIRVHSAGKRVAWGAWFWVKRVIVVLLVCAVGSLLVTMVMNPTLAFFDAADLLLGRAADLIGRING